VRRTVRLGALSAGRSADPGGRVTGYLALSTKPPDGDVREALRVTGTGNVGIGTPDPQARLHVAGGNWNPGDSEGDLKVGDATYRLKIGVATGGGGAGDVRIRAHGGTNRLMLGSGMTDTLFVLGGNVGIGTPDPQHPLHVTGNARVNNAIVGDVGHGGNWAGFAHASSVGGDRYGLLQSYDGLYTLINKRPGGGHIGFRVGNTDQMVLNDAGNVGIGTTAPDAQVRLHVAGNMRFDGRLIWPGGQGGSRWIHLGGMLLCWGQSSFYAQRGETIQRVNFPRAFESVPAVVVSMNDPGYGSAFPLGSIGAYNTDPAGFSVLYKFNGSSGHIEYYQWIAIGFTP
jgi:hypothetical protein